MGDLLIRNLDDGLKQDLQKSAKLNGRSLSEEAAVLLRWSLSSMADDKGPSAGERLRAIIGDAYWTEEELAGFEERRHEPDRDPPRFDE